MHLLDATINAVFMKLQMFHATCNSSALLARPRCCHAYCTTSFPATCVKDF